MDDLTQAFIEHPTLAFAAILALIFVTVGFIREWVVPGTALKREREERLKVQDSYYRLLENNERAISALQARLKPWTEETRERSRGDM